MPTVSIGCDHGGFALKQALTPLIRELGFEAADAGTLTPEHCSYVPYARAVAGEVLAGRARYGILICCSGIGMSMVANQYKGIRAALCADVTAARLTRQHNDANILCLGGRMIGEWLAPDIVRTFLTTAFLGGRYQAVLDTF